MDDVSQDSKPSGSLFRHRSPTYSKEEVKALVNIVEKYKHIILNKSTNNAACHAKDLAWVEITNLYNSQAFEHNRSTDNLKVKWDNLKREARKISKNLMDIEYDTFNDITGQIAAMLCEAENDEAYHVLDNDKEIQEPKANEDNCTKSLDVIDEKQILELSETAVLKRRSSIQRSANFTPEECKILLKCVRSEHKIILSKKTSSRDIKMKNRAWYRITQCYNRLSAQKRSTKILKTKFFNMRRLARLAIRKNRNLVENTKRIDNNSEEFQDIKLEPEYDLEIEAENCNDDDSEKNDNETSTNDVEEFHVDSIEGQNSPMPDPLETVLNNGDSGLGSIKMDMCSCSDSKEISKLKMELLQYKIEMAKLKKKRIEDIMRADTEVQQAKTTEMALRLRAARLEATAAAMKFAPGHPALLFPPEETAAQLYVNRYHAT
ncbi:hypothetical protein ACJJTC_003702 [Scirpophaga incertulas]